MRRQRPGRGKHAVLPRFCALRGPPASPLGRGLSVLVLQRSHLGCSAVGCASPPWGLRRSRALRGRAHSPAQQLCSKQRGVSRLLRLPSPVSQDAPPHARAREKTSRLRRTLRTSNANLAPRIAAPILASRSERKTVQGAKNPGCGKTRQERSTRTSRAAQKFFDACGGQLLPSGRHPAQQALRPFTRATGPRAAQSFFSAPAAGNRSSQGGQSCPLRNALCAAVTPA